MNERTRRIKELVTQSGKSYQELEVMTGVKKSSLQRYASGVTTKIPMDVIEKLETAFNVPRGYIMGWDESTETKKAAPEVGSGRSAAKTKLFDLAENCTEEEAERLVQMMELFLGRK